MGGNWWIRGLISFPRIEGWAKATGFQFWERLMGACHPDYDRRLQSVVDRAHGLA